MCKSLCTCTCICIFLRIVECSIKIINMCCEKSEVGACANSLKMFAPSLGVSLCSAYCTPSLWHNYCLLNPFYGFKESHNKTLLCPESSFTYTSKVFCWFTNSDLKCLVINLQHDREDVKKHCTNLLLTNKSASVQM